ncbi:hypothetical protein SAMN05444280_1272 [Tangfeifania diversioriginum]|uniref:Uncharacterized protein n=1 Tax=Tangfeifania diversioriginum TaxID=1168035 RepID=A0A1M6LIE3_9BACT|nr:hypothetical protein SAMN05444280_1272 [Tangfeifania diversioriginum]
MLHSYQSYQRGIEIVEPNVQSGFVILSIVPTWN